MTQFRRSPTSTWVQTKVAISEARGFAIFRFIQSLDPTIISPKTFAFYEWMPLQTRTGFETTSSSFQITTQLKWTVLRQIPAGWCSTCGNNSKIMTTWNIVCSSLATRTAFNSFSKIFWIYLTSPRSYNKLNSLPNHFERPFCSSLAFGIYKLNSTIAIKASSYQ